MSCYVLLENGCPLLLENGCELLLESCPEPRIGAGDGAGGTWGHPSRARARRSQLEREDLEIAGTLQRLAPDIMKHRKLH